MDNNNSSIKEIFDKLEEIANDNNWSLSYCRDTNSKHDDVYSITLSCTSPCRQDYNIEVDVVIPSDATISEALNTIAEAIWEEADSTDISYETYIWLDDMGHGRNGAPFDMKECYEDMEWCVNHAKNLTGEIYSTIEEL